MAIYGPSTSTGEHMYASLFTITIWLSWIGPERKNYLCLHLCTTFILVATVRIGEFFSEMFNIADSTRLRVYALDINEIGFFN